MVGWRGKRVGFSRPFDRTDFVISHLRPRYDCCLSDQRAGKRLGVAVTAVILKFEHWEPLTMDRPRPPQSEVSTMDCLRLLRSVVIRSQRGAGRIF